MKELGEDTRRKIAYNCRRATFLIEKKLLARIAQHEKNELNIHLAGCPACRLFERQSIHINRMLHALLGSEQPERILDQRFKRKLKDQIEQALPRN